MGRQGTRGHLKREASPKFWPIQRKKSTWTIRPVAGPHAIRECITLQTILREMLGLAKTRSETKKIVSQGKVLVDGKVRRDIHFPAGSMDVVSITELKKNYRLLPSEKGLMLHPISEDEAKFKICRIENKSTLENGNIQLNLHDGRNLLVHLETPQNSSGDSYETWDTLKIGIPDQEILEHLKMSDKMLAMFVGGKNAGKNGVITAIEERTEQKRRNLLVTIEDEKGQTYQTTLNHVFIVGDKTSRISLHGTEEQ